MWPSRSLGVRREKDRSRSEDHRRHQGALNRMPSRHPRGTQNLHVHAQETSKRLIHRFPHHPPAYRGPASPLQDSKCQTWLSTWQADFLRQAPRSH